MEEADFAGGRRRAGCEKFRFPNSSKLAICNKRKTERGQNYYNSRRGVSTQLAL